MNVEADSRYVSDFPGPTHIFFTCPQKMDKELCAISPFVNLTSLGVRGKQCF